MRCRVIGGSLNVRREPDIESEITHILAEGEEIIVGPEKRGWCRFGSGYVMARWLEPVEAEVLEPEQDIREAAKEIKSAAKKNTKKKAADK